MVTYSHQLSLPWVIWLQSTPSLSFYLKYISILFSQLSLCIQSECRSFTFPYQKLVYNSLHFQKVIRPAHLTLLDLIISIIFLENNLWSTSLYHFLHLPVTSSLLRTISLLPPNSRIFWNSSRCSVEKWWKFVPVRKKPCMKPCGKMKLQILTFITFVIYGAKVSFTSRPHYPLTSACTEVGWDSEPVWTLRERDESSILPVMDRWFFGCPAHRPIDWAIK